MASRNAETRAFTLIELLVVVAIIALLISILLPSLARAKEQAKKAVCLSNLKNIGSATATYAEDDDRNMIMPLHSLHVRPGNKYWLKRAVMWWSWGGANATEPFESSDGTVMLDWTDNKNRFGAKARPLTNFIYPEIEDNAYNLDSFRCPSDRGYPTVGIQNAVIDDFPYQSFEKPCYNVVGNSYRGSLYHYPGSSTGEDRFAVGIWGQRSDTLQNPSQMVWGGDPMFFNMIGTDSGGGWDEVLAYGWHEQFFTENLLYADSSARATRAVSSNDPTWKPSSSDFALWGVSGTGGGAITRGPGYRLDCYPTGGVKFGDYNPLNLGSASLWPVRGYTTTPPPIIHAGRRGSLFGSGASRCACAMPPYALVRFAPDAGAFDVVHTVHPTRGPFRCTRCTLRAGRFGAHGAPYARAVSVHMVHPLCS